MTARRSRTSEQPTLAATVTVRVPLNIRQRGGRKTIIGAVADVSQHIKPTFDNALIKALARAHLWRKQIESGEYASITELAVAEKVNQSYACRLLRLTLLAPQIVEQVLNGRQPEQLNLRSVMTALPVRWEEQVAQLLSVRNT